MAKRGAHGADLADLVSSLLKDGPRKVYPAGRRVRVILNKTIIVDSTEALFVWEHDYYPQYYFPIRNLRNSTWVDKQRIGSDGLDVAGAVVELTIPAQEGVDTFTTNRIIRFEDDEKLGALSGAVRLEFGSMDQWLEEDVPIYVHPKDPFKRIELLQSTRSLEVKVSGETVAKTNFAVHLHETGLPVRYYIPLSAVDLTKLRKSDLITQCPYKGDAEYYDVVINGEEAKDIVWYYRHPTHESAGIAGLLSFYNEKVDIFLDGKHI